MKLLMTAVIAEVLGIAVGASGIVIEVTYGANIGFVLITAGGVLIAAGSLVWAKFFRVLDKGGKPWDL